MALASQTNRSQSRVSGSSGSNNNGPKIALGITAIAAVGLIAMLIYKSGPSVPASNPGTGTTGANTNTNATTSAKPSDTPVKPVEPPPYVPSKITMGEKPQNTLVPGPQSNNPTSDSPGTNPGTPPANTTPTDSADQPGTTKPDGSTPPPPAPQAVEPGSPSREVRDIVENANRAISAGRLVEGRTLLNRALMNRDLAPAERGALRAQISTLNETLFFGSTVAAGDPIADTYIIQSGDSLVTVVAKQGIPVEWQLIQRINKVNPSALKIGQKIKVIRQPLHAIVHKSDYRMDIYAGDPLPPGGSSQTGPDGQDPSWTFIRSFKVGLGTDNGTPEGVFVVKPKSKMVNPRWVNPRNPKEKYEGNDPKNPLGKYWLGLDGADEVTKKFLSYGIHGTIDPDSIGKQMSMGCVRLVNDDIAIVYEMLRDKISSVKIIK